MAKRYYTTEAYEQILKTIEEIDNQDVGLIQEFFTDLFKRIGLFLEINSMDQYESDMQGWYDLVLDSHNTTKSKIDSIFQAVADVDAEYAKILDGGITGIIEFQNALNCLRDVVSGASSLADGKAAVNSHITNGSNALNSSFNIILTKKESRVLQDASLQLLGDALTLGSSFIKACTTGNPADVKKLVDATVATICDLAAITAITMPTVTVFFDSLDGTMDTSYEEYLDKRFSQLAKAEKCKEINSVTDCLGVIAEDMEENLESCSPDSPYYSVVKGSTTFFKVLHKGSEVLDVVADAYDIGRGLKETHDNIDEFFGGKTYTLDEYAEAFEKKNNWIIEEVIEGDGVPTTKSRYSIVGKLTGKDTSQTIIRARTVTPAEAVKSFVSNRIGIPLSDWDNKDKVAGNILKTGSTVWSYVKEVIPSTDGVPNDVDHADVVFGKFKETKTLKDIFDFARDVYDLPNWDTGTSGSKPVAQPSGYGHRPDNFFTYKEVNLIGRET